jgi:hypothetical protein
MPSSSDALLKAEWEITQAQVLNSISFYASSTQASEAARLNIRRFPDKGCSLAALTQQDCDKLSEELNEAIKPVLTKWANLSVEKARSILSEEAKKLCSS